MNEPIVLGRAQGRKAIERVAVRGCVDTAGIERNSTIGFVGKLALLVCISLCVASTRVFADDGSAVPASKERPYDQEALKHYNHAVQLHEAGALRKAIDEYEWAGKLDERMVEAWVNLAGIYIVLHKYTKAIDALDKALANSPNNANNKMILNAYGSALTGLGRYDDAIEKFNDALKIDSSFTAAANNLKRAEQLRAERQK